MVTAISVIVIISLVAGNINSVCWYGNLQQVIKILKRITHLDEFKEYFRNWKQPWYFA
jgi:hypothetical protein